MNFLINLFSKAKKGDGFRAPENPDKYNDKIAQLNSVGNDQYRKMSTTAINRISKTSPQLTPTTTQGSKLAGS